MTEDVNKVMDEPIDKIIDDCCEIASDTIDKVVSLADKYDVDKDDLIEHFSNLFSIMAEICTFKEYRKDEEQEIEQ